MFFVAIGHQFHMCKVMFTMPGIERDSLSQLNSTLAGRIVIHFVKIFIGQVTQKEYPALVQSGQQFERHTGRAMLPVFRFGPQLFFIRFYNRSVFGNRQFHTNISVDMAVGEVMHDLPYRPAMLTIGFVKCTLTEFFDNFFQFFRKIRYLPDVSERIQIGVLFPVLKHSDWITH